MNHQGMQVYNSVDCFGIHPGTYIQLPSLVSGDWVLYGHAACGELGSLVKATSDLQGGIPSTLWEIPLHCSL